MNNRVVSRKLTGMALLLVLAIAQAPTGRSCPDCHCAQPECCHKPASPGDCCVLRRAPEKTATVPTVRSGAERPDSMELTASPAPLVLASFETPAIAWRIALAPPGATRLNPPLRV